MIKLNHNRKHRLTITLSRRINSLKKQIELVGARNKKALYNAILYKEKIQYYKDQLKIFKNNF